MDEMLTAATAVPTALFSGLLLVALAYWLLVAMGQMDIDMFHIHTDHGEVGDLGHHGALDFLSIGKVPLTLLLTLFLLIAWSLSMSAELSLRAPLSSILPSWAYATIAGAGATIAALFGTAAAARPLRKLFTLDTVHAHQALVGRQATITSGQVDERFGTASIATDGPDILLNVICATGMRLARGEQAVVVEHDAERDLYLVAPLPHLRPGFLATGIDGTPAEQPPAPVLPAATLPANLPANAAPPARATESA
ncbi:MAG: DUF1449 family protein [Planctomycetes bacterium]|nr:DUF1449 family protein [Planctomycetota bacterium]